jgi:hypothetical protein
MRPGDALFSYAALQRLGASKTRILPSRVRLDKQALELRGLEQGFETISQVALTGPLAGRGRIAIGYAMEDLKAAR